MTIAKAEKNFAQMALDSGTKKAFLHHLDSNSIIFVNGSFQNGLTFYENSKEGKGVLVWKPIYTGISKAGDVGFSTGPYEFRLQVSDTAVGSGQYSSVWKKNENGEWKVLIDLGIRFPQTAFLSEKEMPAFVIKNNPREKITWQQIEESFDKTITEKGIAGYATFLFEGSWFNYSGHHPFTNRQGVTESLSQLNDLNRFEAVDGGMSLSGDLAYTYGWAYLNGKKNIFLRVWVWQEQGWKIALQVISDK